MNALGVIAIIVVLIAGIIAFSQSGSFSLERSDSGPIATGPGSSEIRNPQPVARKRFSFFGRRASPTPRSVRTPTSSPSPAPSPGASPWEGKIIIRHVQRSGTEARSEYVAIRHQTVRAKKATEGPIDVTGWRIASRRSFGIIPRAFNIPEFDTAEQDILLPPGGELTVTSGIQPYTRNFRENACTGYLNQSFAFTPAIANQCADDNPDRAELLARNFSGACIDFIIKIPECRTAKITFAQSGLGPACLDYINRNFNYNGCVGNFRNEKDFLRDRWRAIFGSATKLFDPRHDTITLYDRNGLVVDTFEY